MVEYSPHSIMVGPMIIMLQIYFCFPPSINNPGNVHDSQVAEQGGVYDKLVSQGRYPILIKTCQMLPTSAMEHIILVSDEATSL
jgi:hypothetical protein